MEQEPPPASKCAAGKIKKGVPKSIQFEGFFNGKECHIKYLFWLSLLKELRKSKLGI